MTHEEARRYISRLTYAQKQALKAQLEALYEAWEALCE